MRAAAPACPDSARRPEASASKCTARAQVVDQWMRCKDIQQARSSRSSDLRRALRPKRAELKRAEALLRDAAINDLAFATLVHTTVKR